MTLLSASQGTVSLVQRLFRQVFGNSLLALVFVMLAASARVSGADNLPPTVRFLTPLPRQFVAMGSPIPLNVEAVDKDGYTHFAEFFEDGKSLGAQSLEFLIPPKPGEMQQYELTWSPLTPGFHELSVVVLDEQGAKGQASALISVLNVIHLPVPLVTIEATAPNTGEPCPVCRLAPGRFKLTRAGDLGASLMVQLKISGTATPGVDYVELPSMVEIPAGQASVDVVVGALDDALVEPEETVVAEVVKPFLGTYRIEPDSSVATVVIHSDDAFPETVPVLTLEVTQPETREPFLCLREPCPLPPEMAPAAFRVTRRGGDLKSPFSFPLMLSGSAKNGFDYSKISDEITIPAGETSVEILVSAIADGFVEGDEAVVAFIPRPPGLPDVLPPYFVDQGEAKVVIHDFSLNITPVVRIEATRPTTSEPCPTCLVLPGVFTVSRSLVSGQDLTVSLSYSGTATPGVDYEKLPLTVTIPAGKASVDLLVLARMDGIQEGSETVAAQLEADPTDVSPPHYWVDSAGSAAKVLIQDGPDMGLVPTVWVDVSRNDTSECASGLLCKIAPIGITFHRTAPRLSEPLSIALDWSGSATFLADYGISDLTALPKDIVFPANEDSVILYLTVVNDCLIEGDESVAVVVAPDPTMGPIERYRVDANRAAAKMVIHDATLISDQPLAVVGIRSMGAVLEQCPPNADCIPAGFEVFRKGGELSQPLEVLLDFSGTATPKLDYIPWPSAVVIPANQSSVMVSSGVVNDGLVEGIETIVATVVCSDAKGLGYAIDAALASATIEILDDDSNPVDHAVVKWVSPADGSSFTQPEVVRLVADAVDPLGAITRLTWMDGDVKIGVSELVFIRQPDPGSVLRHELAWTKPALGDHKLYAVGVDGKGATVSSVAIHVRITNVDAVPVVTIRPLLKETSEVPPGSKRVNIPASFVLSRTGSTRQPLQVFYKAGGTAWNGVDYGFLDGDATIEAGETERVVYVSPITDDLTEGDEVVAISIAPRDAYAVGDPGSVELVIHDAQEPVKTSVRWTSPASGAEFSDGTDISLKIETTLASGYFSVAEFYANGQGIGTDSLIICAALGCEPKPGTLIPFQFLWKAPAPGTYKLTAVVVGTDKTVVTSEAILVTVVSKPNSGLAMRTLPPVYQPGVPLMVSITTHPTDATSSHAVVDHPPAGWTVIKVSDGGAWDPATGGVKFGPFLDHESRVFQYSVTPPIGVTGDAEFGGAISVDGASSRIGGDFVTRNVPNQHPADRDGTEWSLSMDEVTAYGAAWKKGAGWAVGPSPIPMEYVTRAGALWRGGEGYVYNPRAGVAPECWVNLSGQGVQPIGIDFSLPSADLANQLEQLRAQQSFVSADLMPTNSDLLCRIRMVPGKGVRAQAAEARIPAGSVVADISHGGTVDVELGVIRWGPFFDGEPRNLGVRFAGVSKVGLAATASFDGVNVHANAAAEFAAGQVPPSAAPRIAEVRRLLDGSVQLFVVDETAAGCELMYSEDLLHWHVLGQMTVGADCQVHQDTDANERAVRFYRAARLP